jgi:hypothetical protein
VSDVKNRGDDRERGMSTPAVGDDRERGMEREGERWGET